MSGGANKAFTANPVNWLANNVLIIAINPTDNAQRALAYPNGLATTVNIVRAADTATNAAGGTIPVYKVTRGTANPGAYSHQFSAYFLPWMQNGKKLMTLNQPGVDWFFTDTMNGCTFATGPGANPKVGHLNYQVDNTAIDVGKINGEVAAEFAGGTLHRVNKADYMDAHGMVQITTLGRNVGGAWNFYYQRREIVSLIPPRWRLLAGQPVAVP